MLISIVIPAFNEEACLGETLAGVVRASAFLSDKEAISTEIIVVDNQSSDATAEIADRLGATVLKETQRNIARVRNTGARFAHGDVLVFIDAEAFEAAGEAAAWPYQVHRGRAGRSFAAPL